MQFYTTADAPAEFIKNSFSAGITQIFPNGNAPLLALSGFAHDVIAGDIEHGYWSKTMIYPSVTVNSVGIGAGTLIIPVDDSSEVVAGELLRFQKAYSGTQGTWTTLAELLRVVSVDSATQITVERGYQGTTAAAIPDNTVLLSQGTVFEQGSNAPTSIAVQTVRHMNNLQILRNTWDVTGTLGAVEMEMGYDVPANNRMDAAALHAQAIEKSLIFGVKGSDTINGRPAYTMDGIERLIAANAPAQLKECGTTTNYTQLEGMVNPALDTRTDAMTSNIRTILCGSQAFSVINNIGRLSGVYNFESGSTEFGLQFSVFKTSRGVFNIMEDPLFNTNDDWKKMAVGLDLSSIDIPYLKGRKTFHKDIATTTHAANGLDATAGVYTSECTLELRNPFACFILYNMTAAA